MQSDKRDEKSLLPAQDTKADPAPTPASAPPRIVLIDMDGVVADMDAHILARTGTDVSQRTSFDLPKEAEAKVKAEWAKPGFFASMPPVPGAKAAVQALLKDPRFDVRFCTAPLSASETCASEKILWVRKHFGQSASRRVVITDDKSVVRGWILIDDRDPRAKSAHAPEWTHVVFDHPSNRALPGPRLSGWSDLPRLLQSLL